MNRQKLQQPAGEQSPTERNGQRHSPAIRNSPHSNKTNL